MSKFQIPMLRELQITARRCRDQNAALKSQIPNPKSQRSVAATKAFSPRRRGGRRGNAEIEPRRPRSHEAELGPSGPPRFREHEEADRGTLSTRRRTQMSRTPGAACGRGASRLHSSNGTLAIERSSSLASRSPRTRLAAPMNLFLFKPANGSPNYLRYIFGFIIERVTYQGSPEPGERMQ